MNKLYLGLVHYPVCNKNGQIVTTSVTNLDLHDIGRLAVTFGIEKYFIIQPQLSQQLIVQELIDFWHTGGGKNYNPHRQAAFSKIALIDSLESCLAEIAQTKKTPKIIVTDAKIYPHSISYEAMRQILVENDNDYLLLFGTGWGLAPEIMAQADYCLYPIMGTSDYNHLSVRSAAAIILDRLCGHNN